MRFNLAIFLDVVIGLIGLGIVIFVHESGHFIAAKLSGITVEAFSIGWGKKLVGFTRGGTEYRISMLPIGGYCKMKGEESLRKAIEADDKTIEASAGSLFSVSPLKRLFTYLAGPTANLLFSVIVMSFVWLVGFSVQSVGNKIILLTDYPSMAQGKTYPANQAGFQTGDRIVAINGAPVKDFQDIETDVAPYPDRLLRVTVERGTATKTLTVTPRLDKATGAGVIGVTAWVDPLIGSVKNGSAAYIAGLQPGDLIVSANGKKIENTLDYSQVLKSEPNRVQITYMRGGTLAETTLIPSYSQNRATPTTGIAFKLSTYRSQAGSLLGAVKKGVDETVSTLTLTVRSIGLLFSGVNLQQAVSGPIRITYYVGEIATQGFQLGFGQGLSSLFRFLSILSVALFFMNLLPIPALDGGLILISLGEMVSGKSVRPRFFYRYQLVGFAFVFGLIILTTFNDVFFFIKQ